MKYTRTDLDFVYKVIAHPTRPFSGLQRSFVFITLVTSVTLVTSITLVIRPAHTLNCLSLHLQIPLIPVHLFCH